jgi:hypothetical protein
MHTLNHNHYEAVDFCDDGVGVIETHGFRLKINIRIPEQKIVHWDDLFNQDKSRKSQQENKKK